MGSKLVQRCTTGLTCVAILILVAVIVTIWVMLNQGAFRNSSSHGGIASYNNQKQDGTVVRLGIEPQLTAPDITTTITTQRLHHTKDLDERTHLGGVEGEIDIVKPLKISPSPLHNTDIMYEQMRNNHDTPLMAHHSGHFRHKHAKVWDPHPHYEIDAFGQKLLLELGQDNRIVAPNLHITKHWKNLVHRMKHDPKISGCLYSGKIKNDNDSDVTVSLCEGMTGIIRTSEGNYFIEPIKKVSSGDSLSSFLHRIKKISNLPSNDVIDPTDNGDQCETDHHNIVEDDLMGEVVEMSPPSSAPSATTTTTTATTSTTQPRKKRKKREIVVDYFDTPMNYTWMPFVKRTTRQADWVTYYHEDRKSDEYFMKVLVVADKSMVEYHKTDDDLHRYILILMSHVALLFKDASIGNSISLSVVNIWVLKDKEFDTRNSHKMLHEFCDWQYRNAMDRDYDTALLLTRHTVCKKSSECTTLGVAQLGTVCDTSSSCAIVKDIGLSSSYTIAHELGHVLSVPHDEDKRCAKLNGASKQKNVMSSVIQNGTKLWIWSECSKHFVTEFLESGKAKCMWNSPTRDHITHEYVGTLPGESFQVDKQCELQFGNDSKKCSYMPVCENLWCTVSNEEGCRSQFSPWAEGTQCGPNSWCHHGKCIPMDRKKLMPINGAWGAWQEWSQCTRTCGGGIKISKRYCNSPKPENGGTYCTGRGVRYASCNIEPCESELQDFREIQCAKHNGDPKNLPNLTSSVEWVPKYGLNDPNLSCQLYCRVKNSNAYYMLEDKVIDGTKCDLNSFDVCVNGICRPAGCDNKLASTASLDDCGVCNGNNSQCFEFSGYYNISGSGYKEIFRFPKGAANLDIRQKGYRDTHYLALLDAETGKYILNGHSIISASQKEIVFGNNIITYSGTLSVVERIYTSRNRKLNKELILQVLSQGSDPPDITYRYVINRDNSPKYGWRLYKNEWSKCSSICSGVQYMAPICIELATSKEQPESFCSEPKSHQMQKQQCNTHCQLIWNVAQKGPCSVNCGKGVRNVYYHCIKVDLKTEAYLMFLKSSGTTFGDVVDDRHCANLRKPSDIETCYGRCEATRWEYSEWSECSTTCGGGRQRRSAKCVDEAGREIDDHHCKNREQIVEQMCNTQKCPIWSSREWTPCSTTCGPGFRTKPYYCHVDGRIYDPSACDPKQIHLEKEECNEGPCVGWSNSSWSGCSVTCGGGFQSRDVFCENLINRQALQDEYCAHIPKPNTTQYCQAMTCPKDYDDYDDNSVMYDRRFGDWIIGEWSECPKSCQSGKSSRIVVCRNKQGVEDEYFCDPRKRPIDTKECNLPCWNFGDWTDCDFNCEKHRQVSCRTKNGTFVLDEECDPKTKPMTTTKCKPSQCPKTSAVSISYPHHKEVDLEAIKRRYRWKEGKWKQCNNTCGKGHRKRTIQCHDTINDVILVEHYCRHSKKPRETKPCERYSCDYTWIEGFWSPCSETCGIGIKTRNVTCHRVHPGRIIDPNPLPDFPRKSNYCQVYNKPKTSSTCMLAKCDHMFVWRTSEWKPCSHPCGKRGRQIRNVYCINLRTNQRVQKAFCPKELRPPRKRKCNQWRCLYNNCREIQHYMKSKKNQDYLISVHGHPVWIYCYKMDTPDPEEYISLQNVQVNYAENYAKRLRNPHSCPYNGQRISTCDCLEVGPERAGKTEFWKVRLNITTLKILGDDYTFSRSDGMKVPFGTAGDCYSSVRGCSQGMFSIDLTGTSFKISPRSRWIDYGTAATSTIDIREQIVYGKCGGYCGNCAPDPNTGLEVEIT